MFLFQSYQSGSLPSFYRRSVFVLCVLVCFLTAFLFIGCSMDGNETEDTGFIPVGLWSTVFDSYAITEKNLDYFMDMSEWGGDGDKLQGNIARAVDFSNTAGVLIIRVTSTAGWIQNTVGRYTGIYYSEYTGSSIKFAAAINLSDYSSIEATSLSEALSLFTVDNSHLHVDWSLGTPYTLTSETH